MARVRRRRPAGELKEVERRRMRRRKRRKGERLRYLLHVCVYIYFALTHIAVRSLFFSFGKNDVVVPSAVRRHDTDDSIGSTVSRDGSWASYPPSSSIGV